MSKDRKQPAPQTPSPSEPTSEHRTDSLKSKAERHVMWFAVLMTSAGAAGIIWLKSQLIDPLERRVLELEQDKKELESARALVNDQNDSIARISTAAEALRVEQVRTASQLSVLENKISAAQSELNTLPSFRKQLDQFGDFVVRLTSVGVKIPHIESEYIGLLDKSGRLRARLTTDEKGVSALAMYDESGASRIQIQTVKNQETDSGQILLFSTDGGLEKIQLATDSESNSLIQMRDRHQDPVLTVSVDRASEFTALAGDIKGLSGVMLAFGWMDGKGADIRGLAIVNQKTREGYIIGMRNGAFGAYPLKDLELIKAYPPRHDGNK